jgi:hypothetical protein
MDRKQMNKLLDILRNTAQPLLGYVWKAGLISLLPSLAISALLNQFIALKEPPGLREGPPAQILFGVLILSPWVETFLLWYFLWILNHWIKRPVPLALASALVWGVLHSLATPAWGLAIFWPFFVFSTCFIEWRKRSRLKAIAATALVHTFQNTLPAIALLLTQ